MAAAEIGVMSLWAKDCWQPPEAIGDKEGPFPGACAPWGSQDPAVKPAMWSAWAGVWTALKSSSTSQCLERVLGKSCISYSQKSVVGPASGSFGDLSQGGRGVDKVSGRWWWEMAVVSWTVPPHLSPISWGARHLSPALTPSQDSKPRHFCLSGAF